MTDDLPVVSTCRIVGEYQVALLTLNRPAERNPINAQVLATLEDQLSDLVGDDGPDAIIITGAGQAFSAGGDLKAYERIYTDRSAFESLLLAWERVCDVLETCSALTVAMVNGACVAGGLELALACDLVTIADSALMGDGHVRFLQLPGAGGSQRLIRAIGVARAKQWLLTGRLFTAHEAVAAGLAMASFPADELEARTLELVAKSLSGSRINTRTMKQLIRIAQENELRIGLALEREAVLDYAFKTDEARRGLRIFADRPRPHPAGGD